MVARSRCSLIFRETVTLEAALFLEVVAAVMDVPNACGAFLALLLLRNQPDLVRMIMEHIIITEDQAGRHLPTVEVTEVEVALALQTDRLEPALHQILCNAKHKPFFERLCLQNMIHYFDLKLLL